MFDITQATAEQIADYLAYLERHGLLANENESDTE